MRFPHGAACGGGRAHLGREAEVAQRGSAAAAPDQAPLLGAQLRGKRGRDATPGLQQERARSGAPRRVGEDQRNVLPGVGLLAGTIQEPPQQQGPASKVQACVKLLGQVTISTSFALSWQVPPGRVGAPWRFPTPAAAARLFMHGTMWQNHCLAADVE